MIGGQIWPPRPHRLALGERWNVLVDPFFRHCVAYVMMDLPNKRGGGVRRVAAASAFFVACPVRGGVVIYAATAWHVIEAGMIRHAQGLALRIAPWHGQTFHDVPITVDDWVKHSSTDGAVARLSPLPDDIAIQAYPIESLATPESLTAHRPPVGEGDDVFLNRKAPDILERNS